MTRWIDAALVRGGTSKGLFFRADDLPTPPPAPTAAAPSARMTSAPAEPQTPPPPPTAWDTSEWDALFTSAMGSPDPYGRQLDGMGGGISSLSKVMVVQASEREGVDLDYTFAQVAVAEASVDYSGNCGNLSSGVVPFALHAGIITATDGHHIFRLHNTNTGKLVDIGLRVVEGRAADEGDFALTGVGGTSAPIELIYPDPGGSRTGTLLPTGASCDVIEVAGRMIEATLVDATLPLVIVSSSQVMLEGTEAPDAVDANAPSMSLIEELRRKAAVRMGLCTTPNTAPQVVPKVAVVSAPKPSTLLDGTELPAADIDILVRVISMGQAHLAVPGTAAMCLAAAALLPDRGSSVRGTIVRGNPSWAGPEVRLGTPSGVVRASAVWDDEKQAVSSASLHRTARVLMDGRVAVR